jgi:hypothetical protein
MSVIPAFRRLRQENCKFQAAWVTKQDTVSKKKKKKKRKRNQERNKEKECRDTWVI